MVNTDQIESGGAPRALPTDPARRLTTLDVLRGVAVLGILLMNIAGWAFPDAMHTPFTLGCYSAIDFWTYQCHEVFVEGTMRALFSILFGAGVVLLTTRLESTQRPSLAIYYRRTLWLIVFGLFNSYILLWSGDILYTYGVVGLFLYPLRRWRPRTLIGMAVIGVVVGMMLLALYQTYISFDDPVDLQKTALVEQRVDESTPDQIELNESVDESDEWWDDAYEDMEDELAIRRGGYVDVFLWCAADNVWMQTGQLLKTNFLDAAICMLLGMALMKLGILSGERSTQFYIKLLIAGYAIGLPMKIWSAWYQHVHDYDWMNYGENWYLYDVSRIAVALGHMGVIILLVRSGFLQLLITAVAAVGRMALTNYLMQSVVCGLLFYGFGFGLVGQLSRSECFVIAVAIWIAQLIISPSWLHFFQFGPFEWLWRSLTYWRPAPMRKRT